MLAVPLVTSISVSLAAANTDVWRPSVPPPDLPVVVLEVHAPAAVDDEAWAHASREPDLRWVDTGVGADGRRPVKGVLVVVVAGKDVCMERAVDSLIEHDNLELCQSQKLAAGM